MCIRMHVFMMRPTLHNGLHAMHVCALKAKPHLGRLALRPDVTAGEHMHIYRQFLYNIFNNYQLEVYVMHISDRWVMHSPSCLSSHGPKK